MARWVPLSSQIHGRLKWRPPNGYGFAAREIAVSVVDAEVAHAAGTFPLAFHETVDGPSIVALLGLFPGQNLFVQPDGRWTAPYVPAAFRGYPFRLARLGGENRLALCVDEEAGLLDAEAGDPLFGEDGKPGPSLERMIAFHTQVEQARRRTLAACRLLHEIDALVAWPIVLRSEQGETPLQGLLRIDEAKLEALPAEPFAGLRRHGALKIAYLQLSSMRHMATLVELTKRRSAEDRRIAELFKTALAPESSSDKDLDFDWSRLIDEPPSN